MDAAKVLWESLDDDGRRRQFGAMMRLAADRGAEIERMRKFEQHLAGCVNVLADKLAQYTGKTLPTEIAGAESVMDALTECRRLLREAVEVSRCDDEWFGNQIEDEWFVRAAKAAGGDDE